MSPATSPDGFAAGVDRDGEAAAPRWRPASIARRPAALLHYLLSGPSPPCRWPPRHPVMASQPGGHVFAPR